MKQLARREEPPSLFESLLRRLRELATGESGGGLRATLEELLEEEESDEREQFTNEERVLVLNALSFGELRVDDVMVPRADVRGVEVGASLAEVVDRIRTANHSRLLVYRETLDEIVGLVHIKDLLPYWGDGETFRLADVMRPALVVPPSMRVLDLLLEMRQSRAHMAAVVDEFGGTDGLVTVEDLVEEILGDLHLQDEHATNVQPRLEEAGDGVIDADARVDLEDLENRLGMELLEEPERDEVDTLGGLIFALVDRVPAKGEKVAHPAGLTFEILDADPRRIKRVRIHPMGALVRREAAGEQR